MRNVSDKSCRENQNTHFIMFNNLLFENRAVYEILLKNTAEPGMPQMTIWRMRIACWINKATNTRPQYVMLIAFPLQQWLHERASMLRYTYIARLVSCRFVHPQKELLNCLRKFHLLGSFVKIYQYVPHIHTYIHTYVYFAFGVS